MDKLAKHGHEANKAALYGELCALLFAKSHYDEVGLENTKFKKKRFFFFESVTLNLFFIMHFILIP